MTAPSASPREGVAPEDGAPILEPAGAADAPTVIEPSIRVRHLWHRFGALEVLRDVSFDVYPGEIYGFIGPNGAGKTTTIRIMATLLDPMAGRVEIDGLDVALNPEEVRHLIGYMPDHAGVYDRITVREYLEFFADAFQVPSLGVVDAVLELTDLKKLEERLVVTMSKGMKQRLQLARILLHDPKVLILDEPASDLDPRARIEIRDLLVELKSLGKTIFLSSHILTELSDVCTSIGILERGHLVVSGPIDEIGARLEAQRAAAGGGPGPPHVVPAGYGVPPGYAAPQAGYTPAAPRTPGAVPFEPKPEDAPPSVAPRAPAGETSAGEGDPAATAASSEGPAPLPTAPGPEAVPGPGPHAAPQPVHAHPAYPQGYAHPAAAYGPPVFAGPAGVFAARRKVKLRVLGDPRHAAYLLHGGPGILGIEMLGASCVVTFEGNDVKIAEIVYHLVRHGIGVIAVEPERNELERIFLEVTRGDVQ